jgi:hypothetical protein
MKTTGTGFAEVRDLQTTGVIAFAKGLPFSQVKPGNRWRQIRSRAV